METVIHFSVVELTDELINSLLEHNEFFRVQHADFEHTPAAKKLFDQSCPNPTVGSTVDLFFRQGSQ